MGQLVGITEKPSSTPGIVRFEANRNLTGMGHERFRSVIDAGGSKPSAVLARRLFETGQVAGVHVYGNMIQIELERGYRGDGLGDVVRNMYQYWKPGMELPVFEEPEAPADAPAVAAGDGGGADAALSEAAKRVPAELLERSRLARERWKASHAG